MLNRRKNNSISKYNHNKYINNYHNYQILYLTKKEDELQVPSFWYALKT